MTKLSSCGDWVGTSIGKWTRSKDTETMFLACYSTLAWIFCCPTQKTRLCVFGILIVEYSSISSAKTQIDSGSLLHIPLLTTSQQATTMAWQFLSWKGRTMHRQGQVRSFSSLRIRIYIVMTFRAKRRLSWQPLTLTGSKSCWTSLSLYITTTSTSQHMASFSTLTLKVAASSSMSSTET